MQTPRVKAILELVQSALDHHKAENTVVVNLKRKTAIADYLIIASGTSKRHVGAMADHVQSCIKEFGFKSAKVEGAKHCDWVLIDLGDIIVHLFRHEVREFYNLEKIWLTGPEKDPAEALGIV